MLRAGTALEASTAVNLLPRVAVARTRSRPDGGDQHGDGDLCTAGVITIRYSSRPHHIGLSKRHRGTKVTVLTDNLDLLVIDHDAGQLIRRTVLDPPATTNHAASHAGTHPKQDQGVNHASGHLSTMSPRGLGDPDAAIDHVAVLVYRCWP